MDYRAKANSEALQDKMLMANLEPKQFAGAIGMRKDRIEALLAGDEPMTALELYRFCEFFGCALEDFFIGIFDFRTVLSEFPKEVTPEFREKYLLQYFRQIRVPDVQNYICGLVRAIAKDER
jgi:transcriptional regulator with XRE-family HTH domain